MKILTQFHEVASQVPDGVKVTTAIAAPALSFLGLSPEEWTYILSAIVSILFIIEKLPMLFQRIRTVKEWIDAKRKK